MKAIIPQHITFITIQQVADYFTLPVGALTVQIDTRYNLQCLLDARTGDSLAFRPLHGGCWGIV